MSELQPTDREDHDSTPVAALRLELLGGFRAHTAKRAALAPISGKKAKALLAYLAVTPGQRYSRDRLAMLLWEDSSDTRARNSLRQALLNLRRTLPRQALLAEADLLGVAPGAIEVDALTFELTGASADTDALERALNLYHGEFLEGFNPRAPAFEDWLMTQRSRLQQHALALMTVLLERYREKGEVQRAAEIAIRLLALDPLRESVQRRLMQLYANQGQFGAALKQYRVCKAVLRRELGIAPEAETDQLYRDIASRRSETPPLDTSAKEVASPPARRLQAHREGSSFIGRYQERQQLAAALDACLETGCTGQSFLLRGEAGIGKTRLAQELSTLAAERGFACQQVQVLEFGAVGGHGVIRTLVRGLLNLPADADAEQARAAALRLFGKDGGEPEQLMFLCDLLGLPQPAALKTLLDAMDNTARRRTRQALLAWLVEISSYHQPLLLVVEDIHWADAPTLRQLAAIAAAGNECPLLLVMTSRVENEPLDPGWRGAMRGASLTTIDLRPLREVEALELAQQSTGLLPTFVGRCVERAAGNPLFLKELLRTGHDSETGVPDSVESLVKAQLERLAPADRVALQTASALGQRFSPAPLEFLLEELRYDLERLIERRLLRTDDEDFAFTHALIQDAIYATLSESRRRELHRRAADWYQGRDAVLHADHLQRAEDPAAAAALLAAAREQAQQFRHERALDLTQRGLLQVDDRATEYELSCLQGELLQESGAIASAIEEFEHASNLADDDGKRCRAWLGQVAGLRVQDSVDQALELLNQAEPSAKTNAELAQVHYHRGSILFWLGRTDDCLREHQRAVALARQAGSPDLEACALSGLGDAHYLPGRMLTAYRHFDQCISRCREHNLGRVEVANLAMRGATRFYCGDLSAALEDCQAAVALAVKAGNQRAEIVARNVLASEMPYYSADWNEVKRQAEQALMLARGLGSKQFQAESLCHLGTALTALGAEADAVTQLEQGYALSQEIGITVYGSWLLACLARATSDRNRRRRALAEGESILEKGSTSHNHLHFYQIAIDLALDDGDCSEAERYAALLENYTRAEPLPWSDFYIARGRALAAHGQGIRSSTLSAELRRLHGEAERVGLSAAVASLSEALGRSR